MDRRLTPANARVAHVSLQGRVAAARFVEGTPATIVSPVTALLPVEDPVSTGMDRQLLLGEQVIVLEHHRGCAFVMSKKDGYVGWVSSCDVNEDALIPPTHIVCQRSTHFYRHRDMKQSNQALQYSLGSHVTVEDDDGRFAKIKLPCATDNTDAEHGYQARFVPSRHIRPLSQPETDPVAVAERLLGTPYLWGGNSAFGIDCSGLVQIACQACAIPCPGDSDLQQTSLGETLSSGTPPQRGDLLFWKGHVAWVSDAQTLLHANAHHMAVAYEPIDAALERILTQGDGPVMRHARLPHVSKSHVSPV